MRNSRIICVGACLGGLAVVAGAFGAHGLEDRLTEADLQHWETGARYEMYHGLALVLCGLLADRGFRVHVAAWSFLSGTVLFSGTLYGLALGGPRWLGAITPIGGTLLIVGWMGLAFVRRESSPNQPL